MLCARLARALLRLKRRIVDGVVRMSEFQPGLEIRAQRKSWIEFGSTVTLFDCTFLLAFSISNEKFQLFKIHGN